MSRSHIQESCPGTVFRDHVQGSRCPDTIVWSMRFCDFVLFCPLKASRHPDPHSYRQTSLSVIRCQPTDFLASRRISARSYLLRPISDIHYPPPELSSVSPSRSSDIHSPPSVSIVRSVGSDDRRFLGSSSTKLSTYASDLLVIPHFRPR